MRSVARLKMGYYPLPENEGRKLCSLLSFSKPASVIDPCVGQGTALQLVTSDANLQRYGVELDAERARIDFAIADELHQLAGDTAQGNGLGVLGRAAKRLIALTGTLMGGYADDLFNIFYRMEPRVMVREGFAYGGQGRRDFQEQYGVLETVERLKETDNACSKATKKTIHVLRKPGASPLLFGKFLMNTTAFLSLEDISDNLPRYDESVMSVDMDGALQEAYEEIEEDIRNAMQAHRGNKSLMSILLNTLLLFPDHPYGFEEIWARAFDPTAKEYVKFLVTRPQNLTKDFLYAKERALIADVRDELRQGRRCQVYATFTGERDVTLRLETVLRQAGFRVAVLRSSVPTDKREGYDTVIENGQLDLTIECGGSRLGV
jgi:hypothetical protein